MSAYEHYDLNGEFSASSAFRTGSISTSSGIYTGTPYTHQWIMNGTESGGSFEINSTGVKIGRNLEIPYYASSFPSNPAIGSVVYNGANNTSGVYYFDGALWIKQAAGGTAVPEHNNLSSLDGGDTNEYYHLTNAQHTDLTDGRIATSHYHDKTTATGYIIHDTFLKGNNGSLVVRNTGDTNYASIYTNKYDSPLQSGTHYFGLGQIINSGFAVGPSVGDFTSFGHRNATAESVFAIDAIHPGYIQTDSGVCAINGVDSIVLAIRSGETSANYGWAQVGASITDSNFSSLVDNTMQLGWSQNRWSTIYTSGVVHQDTPGSSANHTVTKAQLDLKADLSYVQGIVESEILTGSLTATAPVLLSDITAKVFEHDVIISIQTGTTAAVGTLKLQTTIDATGTTALTPNAIQNHFINVSDPRGFELATLPQIQINFPLTHDFTISHTADWSFWVAGKRFTNVHDVSYTLDMEAASIGSCIYIYMDTNGALQSKVTFYDFGDGEMPVAIVYKSAATDYILFDERHLLGTFYRDHYRDHVCMGAMINQGGFSTSFTTVANTAGGIFFDESTNVIVYDADTSQGVLLAHRETNVWKFVLTDDQYWLGTSTTILYDDNTANSHAISNNDYGVMYIVVSNYYPQPTYTKRFITIPGQAKYTTLALARNASWNTLTLGVLPTPEFKLLYKVIIKQNASSITIVESQDLRDTKIIGGTITLTDHQTLSNRSAHGTHPAASIEFTPYGGISTDNLQSGLMEENYLHQTLTGLYNTTSGWANTINTNYLASSGWIDSHSNSGYATLNAYQITTGLYLATSGWVDGHSNSGYATLTNYNATSGYVNSCVQSGVFNSLSGFVTGLNVLYLATSGYLDSFNPGEPLYEAFTGGEYARLTGTYLATSGWIDNHTNSGYTTLYEFQNVTGSFITLLAAKESVSNFQTHTGLTSTAHGGLIPSSYLETASITDGADNKIPCSNLVFDGLAAKLSTTVKITTDNVESAVDLKHAAVTVSAPISLSTQALSLVNDHTETITAIEKDSISNSATVIPCSALVYAVKTTADSALQSIADEAITNAKLAHMATVTIKGRKELTTGDPQDLSAAEVRTIINVADGANNYVHPATSGNKHIPSGGASGNILEYDSDGTAKWVAPTGGVADGSITFAKIQDITGPVVIGRITASAGVSSAIPIGTSAGNIAAGDHTHTDVYEPHNDNIQAHVGTADAIRTAGEAQAACIETSAITEDLTTKSPSSQLVFDGLATKTTLTAVKADVDIASAISLKHGVNDANTSAIPIGYLETTWSDSDTKVSSSKAMATKTASMISAAGHAAVTIDGTSPLSLSTQAISLKNDAAAAITEVDTGTLDTSDTKIPTNGTVKEAVDLKSNIADPTFTTKITTPYVISSVAIGTAPFQPTSTTKCTNLNADQVDGADLETGTGAITDSDSKIPSSKMVKTHTDSKLATNVKITTDNVESAVDLKHGVNDANTSSIATANLETASITDGSTTKVPCSNLVFDGLAGKESAWTKDEIILYNQAGTTLTSSASTDIPWSETTDTNSSFSTPTFTAKYAGMYMVDVSIFLEQHTYAAGDRLILMLVVDDVIYISMERDIEYATSEYYTSQIHAMIKCVVGTTIKMAFYNGHGSNLTLFNSYVYNKCSIVRIY
jgi:hypothetical protein